MREQKFESLRSNGAPRARTNQNFEDSDRNDLNLFNFERKMQTTSLNSFLLKIHLENTQK